MKIIRVKNGLPYKYGVLTNEPTIGDNEVCYWLGKQNISSDKFEVVENADFGEFEVYRANAWKARFNDNSIYISPIDEYRYRECYKKLYAEEIEKSINAWSNLITERNKHRESEDFDGDIAGQFMTNY